MTTPATPPATRLESTTLRLTALSAAALHSPQARFTWPTHAATDQLSMSMDLLPMVNHPLFLELNDEQKWRLALLEAVNFFSLNISGERDLMTGLAARLYRERPAYISRYLQHFLHEENAHTGIFARFCLDYGGLVFRDRHVRFTQHYLPGEEDFVFFTRALIFEEIAHHYNCRMAVDQSLWVLARDINRYHAEDEARHIAFGRLLVADMWERFSAQWSPDEQRRIAAYIFRYVQTVQRSYVNADVYRSLGLPAQVRDEILASAHWIDLAEKSSRAVTRWLESIGVNP
jgi:hypothetical protein